MVPENVRIPADYHTHTALCGHGQGRPADYLRVAAEKGLPGLACTDHAPAPDGYDPEHRMPMQEFATYRAWAEEAAAGAPITFLYGIEADYYPACEAFLREWLPQQGFDLVLGSIHFLDYWGFDSPEGRMLWGSADVTSAWRRYFELLGGLAAARLYDVVSHLDLPKKFGHRPKHEDIREMALPVLDVIARSGMAIEVNTSGLHHPVAEIYPSPEILAWSREREIPLVFGSDAHKPEWVGSDFPAALEYATAAGYTHSAQFSRRKWKLVPLP